MCGRPPDKLIGLVAQGHRLMLTGSDNYTVETFKYSLKEANANRIKAFGEHSMDDGMNIKANMNKQAERNRQICKWPVLFTVIVLTICLT